MALTLFRRPAPDEPPTLEDELWPETGETWTPEGLTVVERYYNLANAVVILYTADHKEIGTYYAVACLGCHYLVTRDKHRTYSTRLTLEAAAKAANGHASTCRALARSLPARPDDDTARRLLRTWVLNMRRRDQDYYLHLRHFDSRRLELQRTDEWMHTELEAFAADRGDVLSATPSKYGAGIEYELLREPS
ncbi:hypothetical protein ABT112_26830 [Streptomyces sp. NPDC002055]|uniref:hypothetical protein n=1 Tax=Streptomyces sp. NPDC002055 TaxID=3154534 RepID=UPI00331B850A